MVGCYAYFLIQDHYLTVTYGVPQLGMPNYGTGNRITTCQYILMVQCKCYLLVLKTFHAVASYSLHLQQSDYLSQYFSVSENLYESWSAAMARPKHDKRRRVKITRNSEGTRYNNYTSELDRLGSNHPSHPVPFHYLCLPSLSKCQWRRS